MTQELIERLRRKAGQYDSYDWHSATEVEAAAALERMVTELETANRIKTEQIDYAIGLQRAIEAHCLEELAPEDVCPHHAEKLNEHFNRQQVLEKEHTEFYSEVVTLRSTVEHLRLRENRLTAERDVEKEHVRQRALLVRARNLLSQPAHWGADDDHIKSRYALYTEINEHIAGEKHD